MRTGRVLRSPYVQCVAIYLAAFGLARMLGYGMVIPSHYWQLLDSTFLVSGFGRSLLYLHMQPPLLNLGYGSALILGEAAGTGPAPLLLAAAVVGAVHLCRTMIPNRAAATACALVIVLHPGVYLTQHHFFYTYYEWALLLAAGAAVCGCLERPSARRLAMAGAVLVSLVYLRSLIHFAWALALLGALALYAPAAQRSAPRPSDARRRSALVLAIAAIVLIAWPLKNEILFGRFTYSTWSGYNLSSSLNIKWKPDRTIPVPERFRSVPAVAQSFLRSGALNGNSYLAMKNFEVLGRRAQEAMRANPKLVLDKAARNYWSFGRFTMRHPYGGYYGLDRDGEIGPASKLWMAFYDRALFLEHRRAGDLVPPGPGSAPVRSWCFFMLAFPLVIAGALVKAVRTRRADPVRAGVAAFMLACILWVLAMVLFVDGTEGNRMRFSTEPFLFVLAFWLWPWRRPAPSSLRPHDG